MSRLVDERVVEMEFDNKKFDKNIDNSIKSIDNLKTNLDFTDTSRSISKSLSTVDVSSLSKGLNNLSQHFSALEVAAITTVANITNRFVNAGLMIAKSLSVDNIFGGWRKFSEKTISVATLMGQNLKYTNEKGVEVELTDLGEKIEFVNEQLKKLTFFADETSYTFTDMVSNISKFTASGQNLDASVEAMMGIANWAALSGQNASTASRAMYQLSQAMGAGVIRLMDWRSIQNANMDTDEFRQHVLDTAVAMGTLKKSIDGTYSTLNGKSFSKKQFTTQLSEGWFTADVLMNTLKKYSSAVDDIYKAYSTGEYNTANDVMDAMGDTLDAFGLKAFKAAQECKTFNDALDATVDAAQSAWMNIFEHIIGGYTDAKKIWTDLAGWLWDVFVSPVDQLNSQLEVWDKMGGRNDLFANTEEQTGAFWNLLNAVKAVIDLVKTSWRDIFPKAKAEEYEDQLNEIATRYKEFSSKLKEMSTKLKMSDKTMENVRGTLKGFFAILKIGTKIVKSAFTAIKPLFGVAKSFADFVFSVSGKLGNSFSNLVTNSTILETIGTNIAKVLTLIIDKVRSLHIIEKLSPMFEDIKTFVISIWNYLSMIPALIAKIFHKHNLADTFDSIAQKVGLSIASLGHSFSNLRDISGYLDSIEIVPEYAMEKFAPLVTFFEGLKTLMSGIWSIVKAVLPIVGTVFKIVGELLNTIGNGVSENMMDKTSFKTLGNIFTLILSGTLMTKLIQVGDKIGGVLQHFIGILDSITAAINAKKVATVASALKSFAIAITLLTASLLILSTIKTSALLKALGTVVALMGIMEASIYTLSLISRGTNKSIRGLATTMIKLSIALLLMSSAFKKLASIDTKGMKNGLITVTSLMAEMTLVALILSRQKRRMMKGTGALVLMAIAIKLLVKPIKTLSEIKFGNLAKALGGITYLIGISTLLAYVGGSKVKASLKVAVELVIFALALRSLAKTMNLLSSISWEGISKSLTSLTYITGLLIGFGLLNRQIKTTKSAILMMVPLSIALLIASKSMQQIALISWDGIAKSLLSISAIIAVFILYGASSKKMKRSMTVISTMLPLSVSLLIMGTTMTKISKISWDGIAKALLSIMSIIGIVLLSSKLVSVRNATNLVIMGAAIAAISASLLLFSASIAAIGHMSLPTIGKGLMVIATSLGVLAIAATIIKPSISTLIGFSTACLLLSTAITVLAAGFSMIITVGATFGSTLVGVIGTVCDAIIQAAPNILAAVKKIFEIIFDALVATAKKLWAFLKTLFLNIIDLIKTLFPEIIKLILELLKSTYESIKDNLGEIIHNFAGIIIAIIDGLKVEIPLFIDHLVQLICSLVKGSVKAVLDIVSTFADCVIELVYGILDTIKTSFHTIVNKSVDIVIEIITMIGDTLEQAPKRLLDAFLSLGESIAKGIWNGIKVAFSHIVPDVTICGKNLRDEFQKVLGIHSPSKMTEEMGEQLVAGFEVGVNNETSKGMITATAESLSKNIDYTFRSSLGIHSPSKLTAVMGEYLVKGLAEGIDNNVEILYGTSENLKSTTTNIFSKTINKIIEFINNGIPSDALTITPVMDLSEIQNGSKQLYGLLDKNSYSMNGSIDLANNARIRETRKEGTLSDMNNKNSNNNVGNSQTINNVFNISGNNPKEIANEVSKILQNQVERRHAKNGLCNI